jgi:hypothetical protein
MSEPEPIELGEVEGGLRYWLAKEAIRQAELHLAAQATSLTAMESRATSILSWSVAGVFVLGSASLTGQYRAAALVAALFLFISAVLCVVGLWPRNWGIPGYPPGEIIDSDARSELEFLEFIVGGYAKTIIRNEKRLSVFGNILFRQHGFSLLRLPLSPA